MLTKITTEVVKFKNGATAPEPIKVSFKEDTSYHRGFRPETHCCSAPQTAAAYGPTPPSLLLVVEVARQADLVPTLCLHIIGNLETMHE